ncbi:hypothetical protein BT93_K0346 [Corymbia citriodora subsp. variegata]|nr:hypothetical protein BT93_K0346 [Corymbia citriodora subsp. variegata]
MASLFCPSPAVSLQNKVNHYKGNNGFCTSRPRAAIQCGAVRRGSRCRLAAKVQATVEGTMLTREADAVTNRNDIGFLSIHHVGILCENLERSLDYYQNLLGLEINEARPHDKLPYRGAWLWVGSEMIHLMELPNPDPLTGRPEHGGRDRHTCISIKDVSKLKAVLDKAGIPYTLSKSGRPAIFTRDPDANALEFVQLD